MYRYAPRRSLGDLGVARRDLALDHGRSPDCASSRRGCIAMHPGDRRAISRLLGAILRLSMGDHPTAHRASVDASQCTQEIATRSPACSGRSSLIARRSPVIATRFQVIARRSLGRIGMKGADRPRASPRSRADHLAASRDLRRSPAACRRSPRDPSGDRAAHKRCPKSSHSCSEGDVALQPADPIDRAQQRSDRPPSSGRCSRRRRRARGLIFGESMSDPCLERRSMADMAHDRTWGARSGADRACWGVDRARLRVTEPLRGDAEALARVTRALPRVGEAHDRAVKRRQRVPNRLLLVDKRRPRRRSKGEAITSAEAPDLVGEPLATYYQCWRLPDDPGDDGWARDVRILSTRLL